MTVLMNGRISKMIGEDTWSQIFHTNYTKPWDIFDSVINLTAKVIWLDDA